MHGGSGSSEAEIREAVSNGVVKMNVDTDTQGAYWDGLGDSTRRTRATYKARLATLTA